MPRCFMDLESGEVTMKLDVNGVTLNITERGDAGPTNILLHYYGGSSLTWVPVMEHLADTCRCFALDLRGWGASKAPAGSIYSVDQMAEDVAESILAMGLQQYALVGHSMGGKIALALAARQPTGLQKLILVAPSPPSPEPMTDSDRAQLIAAWGDAAASRTILASITAHPLSAPLTAQVIDDNLRASEAAWVAWPTSGSREDISDRMAQVNVPTRIIAGGADSSMTPDLLAREVQARIAGSTLTVIPDVAHLIPIEAPEAVAEMIRG